MRWLRRERRIWHKRFIPSLIAGVAVGLLTLFFQVTTSNLVLFASLGASAAILTDKDIHNLSKLRTVLLAYFVALIVSLGIIGINQFYKMPFSVEALLAVTTTLILMYLFNLFHPPAVAASLAFVLFQRGIGEMLLIFASVLVLMVVVRVLTYAFYYENLKLRQFMDEFRKIAKRSRFV